MFFFIQTRSFLPDNWILNTGRFYNFKLDPFCRTIEALRDGASYTQTTVSSIPDNHLVNDLEACYYGFTSIPTITIFEACRKGFITSEAC
jgi:hypothetical protein